MIIASFPFLQEFTILFELRFKTFSQNKISKKSRKSRKLIWLLQNIELGIFGDFGGSRKSKTNLFINLSFSVHKLQKIKNNTFF